MGLDHRDGCGVCGALESAPHIYLYGLDINIYILVQSVLQLFVIGL